MWNIYILRFPCQLGGSLRWDSFAKPVYGMIFCLLVAISNIAPSYFLIFDFEGNDMENHDTHKKIENCLRCLNKLKVVSIFQIVWQVSLRISNLKCKINIRVCEEFSTNWKFFSTKKNYPESIGRFPVHRISNFWE